MSKEKKIGKDEQLKFMKNQYGELDGWFTRSLELLTNVYQRPTEPGVRTKIKDFLGEFDIDPTHTGL
tara:strand:+ start:139 stop:339 length:201 start_codon:yes stop_codon:yes gene_type:complete